MALSLSNTSDLKFPLPLTPFSTQCLVKLGSSALRPWFRSLCSPTTSNCLRTWNSNQSDLENSDQFISEIRAPVCIICLITSNPDSHISKYYLHIFYHTLLITYLELLISISRWANFINQSLSGGKVLVRGYVLKLNYSWCRTGSGLPSAKTQIYGNPE